ncbi:MAG TPA: hypothetical protein PKD86_09150 [Gemmatales bacterium]|nr:hypothetical protein [Gemmatales bacterium]HMP59505.1 hypothetical protein [Gemmatales bacterium]
MIQCEDACLSAVQRELIGLRIRIAGTFVDVESAVTELARQKNKERHLLIVQLHSNPGHDAIAKLNNRFEGWPILALIPGEASAQMLLQASRAGAAQFVSLPVQSNEMKEALNRLALQFGFRVQHSKVVAISGVSEGAGATSLAINLADEMAHRFEMQVMLVELTRRSGRLAVHLNLKPRFTTSQIFQDPERFDVNLLKKTLVPVHDHLHVLAGPPTPLAQSERQSKDVLRLLTLARDLASLVIVDMPYDFDDTYVQTMLHAEVAVLVGQPVLPSVHSMGLIRSLLQQQHYAGQMIHVFNRYNPGSGGYDADQIRKSLDLNDLATVAEEAASFNKSANLGRPLREIAPHSKALKDIRRLADLINADETAPRQHPGLWTRLLGRLRGAIWRTQE